MTAGIITCDPSDDPTGTCEIVYYTDQSVPAEGWDNTTWDTLSSAARTAIADTLVGYGMFPAAYLLDVDAPLRGVRTVLGSAPAAALADIAAGVVDPRVIEVVTDTTAAAVQTVTNTARQAVMVGAFVVAALAVLAVRK